MPFVSPLTPSIQLGTLSSYLRDKGIRVDTLHAYLKCANTVEPELYYTMCSTFSHEIFYPSFLYPANFKKYRRKIKRHYNRSKKTFIHIKPVAFETILDRLRFVNRELLTATDFSKYSLIGFSITYDQLRPSIYLAKKIKKRFPHIPIVFGGAHCADNLGISLLKTFSEVDFVVSGEGEETLASLCLNINTGKFDKIKGLIWRNNESVKFNGPPDKIPAANLPIPAYEEYFNELGNGSPELNTFVRNYLTIPIEGSRGCWWNKCTFCSLNMQYSGYREKPIDQIIHEVEYQVDKYKCHSIEFVDNTQRVKNVDKLMSGIINLKKDLNIFLEIRAGSLKKEDYKLMKNAGAKIVQIGIESFGSKMLQKMNKGVTPIENIAALKYCQEFGILPVYNIIINYPNENDHDLKESEENVKFLKNLVPPAYIQDMQLMVKSPIDNNLKEFNIKEKKLPENALWFFPKKIWQSFIPINYDYEQIIHSKDNTSAWQEIFRPWKQTGEERLSTLLLYYQDAGDFLALADHLSEKPSTTILEGIERNVYLFCDTIRTKQDILNHFPELSSQRLIRMIKKWVSNRWMFMENDKVLSLAIRINPEMSSVMYLSDSTPYSNTALNIWKPPRPKWKLSLKMGSIATLNFSLTTNKIPAWLKRIKKSISRE